MNMPGLADVLRSDLSAARVCNEVELQAWVGRILTAHGVAHQRERALPGVGRPDFLVGRVAVEVKVDGSRMALLRQVLRYATCPEVGAILVVTTRLAHRLPATLQDKPVTVICVTAFGVM